MASKLRSVVDMRAMKAQQQKISMVTCYDYSMACLVEASPVDIILVGDSGGMVQAGYDNTLPVTVDEMIYHARAVHRGAPRTPAVVDLPFMSYHVSIEDSLRNAGRIMKETGAGAVKLEGGEVFVPVVEALVKASIPVVGHLGLTPQSVQAFGGFRVQGRDEQAAARIRREALMLQDAGICALVLELVPEPLAQQITAELEIPTVGIGAGRYCDGQVLVINDLLGMNAAFNPVFLKKYADLSSVVGGALAQYDREVKDGAFPQESNAVR